jgi:hypothetical protein
MFQLHLSVDWLLVIFRACTWISHWCLDVNECLRFNYFKSFLLVGRTRLKHLYLIILLLILHFWYQIIANLVCIPKGWHFIFDLTCGPSWYLLLLFEINWIVFDLRLRFDLTVNWSIGFNNSLFLDMFIANLSFKSIWLYLSVWFAFALKSYKFLVSFHRTCARTWSLNRSVFQSVFFLNTLYFFHFRIFMFLSIKKALQPP